MCWSIRYKNGECVVDGVFFWVVNIVFDVIFVISDVIILFYLVLNSFL